MLRPGPPFRHLACLRTDPFSLVFLVSLLFKCYSLTVMNRLASRLSNTATVLYIATLWSSVCKPRQKISELLNPKMIHRCLEAARLHSTYQLSLTVARLADVIGLALASSAPPFPSFTSTFPIYLLSATHTHHITNTPRPPISPPRY